MADPAPASTCLDADAVRRACAELHSLEPDSFERLMDELGQEQPLLCRLACEFAAQHARESLGQLSIQLILLLLLAHRHARCRLPAIEEQDIELAAAKVRQRIAYLKDEPDDESRALAIASLPDNVLRTAMIGFVHQLPASTPPDQVQLLLLSFETFLEACQARRTPSP